MKALADGLREEVNEDGIRVTSLYAGRTATAMQKTVYEFEGRAFDPAYLMTPHDVAASVIHCLSLPRSAEVTDIAIRPMRKAQRSENAGDRDRARLFEKSPAEVGPGNLGAT